MVGVLVAPQTKVGNVGEVSATRFLVHWTQIQLRVKHKPLQVHCKDMNYWDLNEQHFGCWID